MKNKKTLLLFPDGVGIRNYLYSDVFDTNEDDLILFHNFDEKTIKNIGSITNINSLKKIPPYKESIKEKFLRELICFSRLKYNAKRTKNFTILYNWKTNHKKLKNKLFYKTVEQFSKLVLTYNHIVSLEKKYQKAIRKTSYYREIETILKELNPKILFCSHQRGIQCATIFAVAKDLGIASNTVIYSWDNLPKARLALRADKYLVWSEYMKNEMKDYYPEIDNATVIVTGTPQFECYRKEENIIPKEVFYKKYDLDISKKIICYSGDDTKTSPDDPKYLNDLAEELIKNNLDKEYQILLRRCPVDVSGRFEPILKKHKTIIKQAPPIWDFKEAKGWTTIYPLPEDVELLVSTAFYSDIVVNVGSTMAFDFSMFNKPCVFINYDQVDKTDIDWSVKTIYNYQHFKSMKNHEAVIWWSEKEQLVAILKKEFNNLAMNEWRETVLSNHEHISNKIRNSINL